MTDDELRLAAARNFKRALERSGLKQADIVSRTGATQPQVSNWVKRGVSSAYAVSVAAMLGVKPGQICASVHELVGSSEVKAPPAPPRVEEEDRRVVQRRRMPERPARLQRLVDALDDTDLGVVDLALLEELVQRLGRGNRGGGIKKLN